MPEFKIQLYCLTSSVTLNKPCLLSEPISPICKRELKYWYLTCRCEGRMRVFCKLWSTLHTLCLLFYWGLWDRCYMCLVPICLLCACCIWYFYEYCMFHILSSWYKEAVLLTHWLDPPPGLGFSLGSHLSGSLQWCPSESAGTWKPMKLDHIVGFIGLGVPC